MVDSIEEQIERAVRADAVRRDTGLDEALRRCEQAGETVFLLGGDGPAMQALERRLRSAWPRLRLAGACDAGCSGPAGPAILARIAASAPDLVIIDVAPKRHRALIAEFASHGLHTGLVNLPGTFARYLATHPGRTGTEATRPPVRTAGLLAKVVDELASAMRIAGGAVRQILQVGAPSHAAQAYQAGRREG